MDSMRLYEQTLRSWHIESWKISCINRHSYSNYVGSTYMYPCVFIYIYNVKSILLLLCFIEPIDYIYIMSSNISTEAHLHQYCYSSKSPMA